MRKKSKISLWKKNFLNFFLNRNTLSKSPFWRNVLKKGKNYPRGPQNLTFPPICPVYRPVPFCEFYSTGWKRTYPQKSLILPDSDYTLHREKHTHIENITPPRQNYRNYRVKTNTYIKNLNCCESLPAKTTETTGWKWTRMSKI